MITTGSVRGKCCAPQALHSRFQPEAPAVVGPPHWAQRTELVIGHQALQGDGSQIGKQQLRPLAQGLDMSPVDQPGKAGSAVGGETKKGLFQRFAQELRLAMAEPDRMRLSIEALQDRRFAGDDGEPRVRPMAQRVDGVRLAAQVLATVEAVGGEARERRAFARMGGVVHALRPSGSSRALASALHASVRPRSR
jgi:hypothetical protein